MAYLARLGSSEKGEMEGMLQSITDLVRQQKVLKKAVRAKKARDQRLMSKAAKTLTSSQLLRLAGQQLEAEKGRAAAKAKAQARGAQAKKKAKGKTTTTTTAA